MLIRPALVSDLPAVLPVVRALCDRHQSNDPDRFQVLPDVLDGSARWLFERAAGPRSVFAVAESDSRLVGFVVCTVEPEVPIFMDP